MQYDIECNQNEDTMHAMTATLFTSKSLYKDKTCLWGVSLTKLKPFVHVSLGYEIFFNFWQ